LFYSCFNLENSQECKSFKLTDVLKIAIKIKAACTKERTDGRKGHGHISTVEEKKIGEGGEFAVDRMNNPLKILMLIYLIIIFSLVFQ